MTAELIQVGKQALQAGHTERARNLFVKALRTNPEDEQAWPALGQAVDQKRQRAGFGDGPHASAHWVLVGAGLCQS